MATARDAVTGGVLPKDKVASPNSTDQLITPDRSNWSQEINKNLSTGSSKAIESLGRGDSKTIKVTQFDSLSREQRELFFWLVTAILLIEEAEEIDDVVVYALLQFVFNKEYKDKGYPWLRLTQKVTSLSDETGYNQAVLDVLWDILTTVSLLPKPTQSRLGIKTSGAKWVKFQHTKAEKILKKEEKQKEGGKTFVGVAILVILFGVVIYCSFVVLSGGSFPWDPSHDNTSKDLPQSQPQRPVQNESK